jgi:apolipoprotein D and lipocalin family protein
MVKVLSIVFVVLMVSGCTGIPEGIKPVQNFNVNKYQGKWYEIARLDHSFERGLENVSAQYTIKDDGNVEVINKGFSTQSNEWKEAIGNATFVRSSDEGYLKVSFFGPFYGSYVIFELGDDYEYAFVSGPDLSYLWLLSRSKTVEPQLIEKFTQQAKKLGFITDELILVNQELVDNM